MKTILIAGGAGYIGSHLTLKFCKKIENVVAFYDLSTRNKKIYNKFYT